METLINRRCWLIDLSHFSKVPQLLKRFNRFRPIFEIRDDLLLPVVDEDFVFSAANNEYISGTDATISDITNTATIACIIHPP